jgi:hypothetical protein
MARVFRVGFVDAYQKIAGSIGGEFVLSLSDLFISKGEESDLELKVRVLPCC